MDLRSFIFHWLAEAATGEIGHTRSLGGDPGNVRNRTPTPAIGGSLDHGLGERYSPITARAAWRGSARSSEVSATSCSSASAATYSSLWSKRSIHS